MYRAYTRLRLPSGSTADLCPGDIVGRLWNAALRLDDGRISEAHAMVSLRGGALKLLSLRGMLAVDRVPARAVRLEPGLRVALAEGLEIEVEAVELPDQVLAISLADGRPRILTASVYSVLPGPPPRLEPRYQTDASGWLWSTEAGWRIQPGEGPVHALEAGSEWRLGDHRVQAVSLPRGEADVRSTRQSGSIFPPLKIIAWFDTVHLHRQGHPTLALSGKPAQLLSLLVSFSGPVGWEVAAGELWRKADDRVQLRQRWDRTLSKLRDRLREGRVRPDLVRADGTGNYELLLLDGDETIDQT